ncbi:MAG: hypothetical protein PF487_06845 [Bacteroidales bacterium]|jgi:hypothetical protein|nr:hypothetical protein [Bacteroidales bacterium]
MKKTILTLIIILFSISLFAQGFGYNKTYNEKQIKNFFSIDTVKTDDVYVINYTLYVDRLMSDYPYHNYWSYNYNWYYNYLSYNWRYNYRSYNWRYNHLFYSHHYYNDNNHIYKPRPQKPIRKRTITTRVINERRNDVKPERKRKYVRPVRTTTTNSKYSRPTSTYNVNRIRHTNTYNRNARIYNRPARSTNRNYGTSTRSRSSNTTVRSTGSFNKSSSGSRGRR